MSIPNKSVTRLRKFLKIILEVIPILLFTYIIYVMAHELSHLTLCFISGSYGKIFLGLPSHVDCPGILNSTVFIFSLYCLAPYLFLSLPVVILFSVFTFKIRNYYFSLFLIFIPAAAFIDTLNNFFHFFIRENDFHNLLAVSPCSFLFGSLLVVLIAFISRSWIKNYWPIFKKTIQDKIKDNG